MKNLYFVALAFAMLVTFSCEKDKDPAKTTYQIVNNSEKGSYSDPYLDGTLWEVIVFCYDADGDIIRQDNLDPIEPAGGKSELTEVDPECVKLKLSFKFLPPESDNYELVDRVYVVAFTNIQKGKSVSININDETMIEHTLKTTKEAGMSLKYYLQNIQAR